MPSPCPAAADPPSVIEALIVGGDPDWLFVVLTPYYLEIARTSVIDVEELPLPETVHPDRAVAARITLCAGAVIRTLRASGELERTVRRQRRSFATASRPTAPSSTREGPALAAKTAAFFARHGLALEEDAP